jgi:thioredoxin-related protein
MLASKEESLDGNVTAGRRATGIAFPGRSFVSPVRRILLSSIAATLLAGQVFAGPWLNNVADAQKKAKASHRLIFVDLFADWCGWCHRFEEEVIPSQAFQNATDDMVLLRLNTEDGRDGTRLARDYGISSLPTFVVLNEDLMIAGEIRGYTPANEFAKLLKDTIGHYNDFEKTAANEAAYAKDYPKRLEVAKEYRERYGLAQSETRLTKLIGEPALPEKIRDESYYELALTQFLGKHYDEAQKTLKKFSTIQKQGDAYERSRLLVGDIYLTQGNLMAAANEYRAFKTAFPKSPYIRNVDQVLPQVEQRLHEQSSASKK